MLTLGCSSLTTYPIIGSWYKPTATDTIYVEFKSDYTYRQWSSNSKTIITGSWKSEGSDWYLVASYTEGPTGKVFLSNDEWIYDKTQDAIYVKGYPEGHFLRATQPLPSPITPTYTPPKYSPGDIIDSANPASDARWVITSYISSKDMYTKQVIHKRNGEWACVIGGLSSDSTPYSKEFIETTYPVKYGHIDLETVYDCFPITPTIISTTPSS